MIVANSTSAFAVKAMTTTIPMVFLTGSDPVEGGLVTNLNRPGGNITGVVFFSDELGAKRLELLRQFVPKATTVGVLVRKRHRCQPCTARRQHDWLSELRTGYRWQVAGGVKGGCSRISSTLVPSSAGMQRHTLSFCSPPRTPRHRSA